MNLPVLRGCLASRLLFLGILTSLSASGALRAGDWPQILGPQRNGVAQAETLLERWPADGPERLWQVKLGEGFGGPVVMGQRVIAFHRVGDQDRVDCLAVDSGKRLWEASYTATYRGGINPDTGPRSTPVIAGGRVVVFSANGDMHCLELATGKKLWTRELLVDYEAPEGYFGAGSSPLVVADRVLVNVGGRDSSAIVCLNLADGETLWNAYDDTASYSSPALVRWGDAPAAIFITRLNCVGIRPSDGTVLFEFPFGERGPTVNAAVPLVVGNDRMFLSASYGIGARWVAIGPGGVKTLWSSDESLSSQYATAVHHNGYLYGTHGREDVGVASLRAVEAATGKVAWEKTDFGVAHVIAAGDKLLIVRNEGQVDLAAATSKAYQPLATAQVTGPTVRALPALAGGRLFIRSTGQGSGALTCIKVGEIK